MVVNGGGGTDSADLAKLLNRRWVIVFIDEPQDLLKHLALFGR
jgi:hypothetical protein